VGIRAGTWGAALIVAAAVASVNVAAAAHAGVQVAADGTTRSDAQSLLNLASILDPGLALYHRELGVLLATTRPRDALQELERAVDQNPADAAALRALAIQWAATSGSDLAQAAADRAVAVRPISPENWVVMAFVVDAPAALQAQAEALRLAPWLAGSPQWPGQWDTAAALDMAAAASLTAPSPRDPMSLAWLRGVTGDGRTPPVSSALIGLEQVLGCDLDDAQATYEAMGSGWARSTPGIVGRIMLARLRDDPALSELLSLAELNQPQLASAARGHVAPYSALADPAQDQQLYRRSGIDPRAGGFLIPRTLDALGAWMFAPREAAARSMPGSALATCR
jgi:tetratricopeptide (TPR) repeat protein